MVWACFEKRRRARRQKSDGDGGAGEKKERNAKARWLDSIRNDLSEPGEDAQDRPRWRRLTRHIDPTQKWEKMKKKKKKKRSYKIVIKHFIECMTELLVLSCTDSCKSTDKEM